MPSFRSSQKELRQNIIAKYLHLRLPFAELALRIQQELGLEKTPTVPATRRDYRELMSQWRADRTELLDLAVEMELADIHTLVRTLWDEWERSKLPKTMRSKKRKGHTVLGAKAGDPDQVVQDSEETNQREEGRLGDPRYLQLIADQHKERRKLLGHYSPEEQVVHNVDVPLTKEEIEAYHDLFMKKYVVKSE